MELSLFVKTRRAKCPYRDDKSYCSVCKIHCYKSNEEKRNQIRSVMRYAAPRMCITHPILSISHLQQTLKKKRKAKRDAK